MSHSGYLSRKLLKAGASLALGLLLWSAGTQIAWPQQYTLRWYGNADGLANLSIRAFLQDRTGFLWLLTMHDLYRYDGDRFVRFGPEQGLAAIPEAIGEAPDGSVLAGGRHGLYRLNRRRFERLSDIALTATQPQTIQLGRGGVTWLSTPQGLAKLRWDAHGGFRIERAPGRGAGGAAATAILVDGSTVWYGCGDALCRAEEGGRTAVFDAKAGLPAVPIFSIRKDKAGHLWVSSLALGLFELPAGASRFVRPRTPVDPALLNAPLSVDSEGRILIPSPKGLLIGDSGRWRSVGAANGLRSPDLVFCAFEDRSHSLWVSVTGRGVAEWRGYQQWESYSTDSGLASNLVFEILPEADHTIWLGTNLGLVQGTEGASGIRWKAVEAVGKVTVHSVARGPDGRLWLGTESRGLGWYSPATGRMEWANLRESTGSTGVLALRFDRQGRVWVCTESGLVTASAPYRRFTRVKEVDAGMFWAVTEGSDGTVWAGGAAGLFALDGERWRRFGKGDGLSDEAVQSLGAAEDGVIWVGPMGGGIDRVRLEAGRLKVERGVQRAGADHQVYFLARDTKGQMWAGSENGVDVWNNHRWAHFDSENGLVWNDCDLNSCAAEADGTVWVGTSGGLSRRRARPVAPPAAAARVVLTEVSIGGAEVDPEAAEAEARYAEAVGVRFSALNRDRSRGLKFRYRLDGPAAVWTETRERVLHFPRLSPGQYRLEVEAGSQEGEWSGAPAVLALKILPPWYMTWWFRGLCVAASGLLCAIALRMRLMAHRARERELQNLVDQRTAELRQANDELTRLSATDGLTGVANRRAFDQFFHREWARRRRTGEELSVLMLDIDHFKLLNDSLGHQWGDQCLAAVAAALLRLAKRETDLVARYGGEEFVIVLPATKAAGAAQFAEAVRRAVVELGLRNPESPVMPVLTVSIGVGTVGETEVESPEQFLAAVDLALYAAKRAGRNQVAVSGRGELAPASDAPSACDAGGGLIRRGRPGAD